jgi:hypothetical protein
MAFRFAVVYQRIVFEGVVDFDRLGFEKCTLALRVLAIGHSNASRFTANS